MLFNPENTHPGAKKLLTSKGLSVNRSDIPSSRNAVDITIELTINRHAKSRCGIIGLSRNESAYYRWCKTRHTRATYLQATKEMVDMDGPASIAHKEMRPSQISKSEEGVRNVRNAIENFINPFQIEYSDNLYCIASGAPVPKHVEMIFYLQIQ